MMMRTLAGAAIACALAAAGGGAAVAADSCAAEGKVHYLCGPVNVEDMVLTPGTSWIIGASDRPKDGRLYLIDARAKSFKDLPVDLTMVGGRIVHAAPDLPG